MTRNSNPIYKTSPTAALILAVIGLSLPGGSTLRAQEIDPQIESLVQALDSDQLAERNDAEQDLIAIGVTVLDWLDRSQTQAPVSSEAQFRLQRVRDQIFRNSVQAATQQSTVHVTQLNKSELTVEQLSASLQMQTGNVVTFGNAVEFKGSEWESTKPISFWQAIDSICKQHNLSIDPAHTTDSEKQQLNLSTETETLRRNKIAINRGLLRTEWLSNADTNAKQIRMRLFWEPRLRLLGIRIPMKQVSITNSSDQPWGTFNEDAVYNIPAPTNRVFTDLRLPVRRRETDENRLKQVEFGIELRTIAPDAKCLYRDLLNANRAFQTQHYGMASVSIVKFQADSTGTLIQLQTRYQKNRMAQPLQSHIDWSRFCDAHIVLNDGSSDTKMVSALESRQVQQQPWTYTIEYKFPPLEKDQLADLNFRIPSGIISITEQITLSLAGQE